MTSRVSSTNGAVASAAAAPAPAAPSAAPRAKPSLRTRLGDGVWLLVLSAVLVPGVAILALESDHDPSSLHPWGCYSLYWFVALFLSSLGALLALHLLVWAVPRPVSHVDNSPLSGFIGALVVLGPPVFGIWALVLLVYPGAAPAQCPARDHQALWTYFGMVVAAGAVAAAVAVASFVHLLWQAIFAKPLVAPVTSGTVGATEHSTFTTDMALDNGRWLTMEARRIRDLNKKLAVPTAQ